MKCTLLQSALIFRIERRLELLLFERERIGFYKSYELPGKGGLKWKRKGLHSIEIIYKFLENSIIKKKDPKITL